MIENVPRDRATDRWMRSPYVQRYLRRGVVSRDLTVFPRRPPLQLRESGSAQVRIAEFYRSRDPEYLAFLLELSNDLTSKFGGAPGMPENFYKLRNVSGHYGSPASAPIRSNEGLVASRGNVRPLTPDEEVVFLKGFDVVWGNPITAGVHLKRGASPGLVPEPEGREEAQNAIFSLALDNSRDICTLIADGSPTSLWRSNLEYRAITVIARRHRGQPDSGTLTRDGLFAPKEREAIRPEDVTKPKATPITVSKNVELPSSFEGKFAASRERDVGNPSLGANAPIMMAAAQCRAGMYENYPYAYKHSTLDVLNEKLSGWTWAVPCDVVSFDQYYAWSIYELHLRRWLWLGFDQVFVGYMRNFVRQPTIMHSIGPEPLSDPLFGLSPFLSSQWQFARLISGQGDTDLKGRDTCGAAIALAFFMAGLITPGSDCDALYKGRHATLAFLTAGDDNLPGGTNPRDEEPFRRALERSPVCVFKEDDYWTGKFIDRSGGKVKALPSAGNIITNMFWKEHDRHIKSNFDIQQGFVDQIAALSVHPRFHDLIEVIDRCMAKHFGYTMTSVVAGWPTSDSADAQFRRNPRSIYYKLDPADVSPDLLSQVMMSFPAERVSRSVEWVFKDLRRIHS